MSRNETYTINELDEGVRAKVIDRYRDWNVDGLEWWDCTYDDARRIAELMGIGPIDINFSGFWSQGDGASFTGPVGYKIGAVRNVIGYAPLDTELHDIAMGWAKACRLMQWEVHGGLHRLSSHYAHENTVTLGLDVDDFPTPEEDARWAEGYLLAQEILREFMRWIYGRLEQEYEYQTSDEAVADNLEANEMRFTQDGDNA